MRRLQINLDIIYTDDGWKKIFGDKNPEEVPSQLEKEFTEEAEECEVVFKVCKVDYVKSKEVREIRKENEKSIS